MKHKPACEWLEQAEYDLKMATVLFKNKSYIYTIFMSHLAVEKALKGLYAKRLKQNPPKTHDLVYLVRQIELEVEPQQQEFLQMLGTLSVPTRYPETLKKLLAEYKKEETQEVLLQTKGLVKWLKIQ